MVRTILGEESKLPSAFSLQYKLYQWSRDIPTSLFTYSFRSSRLKIINYTSVQPLGFAAPAPLSFRYLCAPDIYKHPPAPSEVNIFKNLLEYCILSTGFGFWLNVDWAKDYDIDFHLRNLRCLRFVCLFTSTKTSVLNVTYLIDRRFLLQVPTASITLAVANSLIVAYLINYLVACLPIVAWREAVPTTGINAILIWLLEHVRISNCE